MAQESFASPQDYEDRAYDAGPWTPAQLAMKLSEASRMVRDQAPQTDKRIALEPGTAGYLDQERVKDIVCAMVSRAVPLTDLGVPMGATSMQVGVDVFQKSLQFGGNQSGGASALYISKAERKSLGIGVQRIFSIDLMPEGMR